MCTGSVHSSPTCTELVSFLLSNEAGSNVFSYGLFSTRRGVLRFFRVLFYRLFHCSRKEEFLVNVSCFLTSRLTFTPMTFCVLRDLKFPLIRNFRQLFSIGSSNLILKKQMLVLRNWCFNLNNNRGISILGICQSQKLFYRCCF